MPQEAQGAAGTSVDAFLSLNADQQKQALGKMSPDAKQALLTGIKSRGQKPAETTPTPTPKAAPNTITGGFARRAWETAKGAVKGLSPMPLEGEGKDIGVAAKVMPPGTLPVYRAAKGIFSGEKEALRQTARQVGERKYGRAAVTALGVGSPGSVGTTTDVNRLVDEKRYREAIGTAAFDVIAAIVGSRMGKGPSARTRLAKLTSAVGETGETASNLKVVMDDLGKTIQGEGVGSPIQKGRRIIGQPPKTGQPIDLDAYHATDTGKLKTGEGGTFFAPEPYKEYGGQVIRYRLSFRNPLVLGKRFEDVKPLFSPEEYRQVEEAFNRGGFDPLDRAIAKKARDAGHDGIIYSDGKGGEEYVALSPETIGSFESAGASASAVSKPRTVGDLLSVVLKTFDRVDQTFNQALFPIRGQQVVPMQISNKLRALASAPNLAMTAEGRAEAAALNAAATEFERPWTYNALNLERMRRRAALQAFYRKESGPQAASLKSSADTTIDKIVRDGTADIVYDAIDRANPGINALSLKRKEAALWELKDHLSRRVGELQDAQLAKEGQIFGQKARAHGYLSPHRAGAYLGEVIPHKGAESIANVQVRQAFGPTGPQMTQQAGVLLMPIERLASPKSRTSLPPPPDADED